VFSISDKSSPERSGKGCFVTGLPVDEKAPVSSMNLATARIPLLPLSNMVGECWQFTAVRMCRCVWYSGIYDRKFLRVVLVV
jgi:hypothetical protein